MTSEGRCGAVALVKRVANPVRLAQQVRAVSDQPMTAAAATACCHSMHRTACSDSVVSPLAHMAACVRVSAVLFAHLCLQLQTLHR
jgi:isoaspartyl peptidase/L-asparaginase-like protein (Ntn-hydrolase superfamily)